MSVRPRTFDKTSSPRDGGVLRFGHVRNATLCLAQRAAPGVGVANDRFVRHSDQRSCIETSACELTGQEKKPCVSRR